MHTLTPQEMARMDGEGFWSGVTCGFAAATALVLIASPEPLGKVALMGYASTVTRCIYAYS